MFSGGDGSLYSGGYDSLNVTLANPDAPNIIDSIAVAGISGGVAYFTVPYFPGSAPDSIRNGMPDRVAQATTVLIAAGVAELANWAVKGLTVNVNTFVPAAVKAELLEYNRLVPPVVTGVGNIVANKYLPFGDTGQSMVASFGRGAVSNVVARAAYSYFLARPV